MCSPILPVAVAGFWLLARAFGRGAAGFWLILVSTAFYVLAGWTGLVVLVPSILFDYLIAVCLLRLPGTSVRAGTFLLTTGIAVNICFLAYFKYKNFFLGTVNSLFDTHVHLTAVVLPLGVSFLTFQKIAFLADVRSGAIEKVRFLDYLLFTTFFPRSVAGPITRYNEIVPQFDSVPARELTTTHLSVGIALFSIGLFKKAFIADQLAAFVTPVFDLGPVTVWDPGTPTLFTSWAAVLAYTFELYFDFSGYSDMALGVARMFGIRLPTNFNSPYKATSIVEFWSRWHITLTRFLTSYIYTPLVLSITRARLAKGKTTLKGARSSASSIATSVAVPTLTTMIISGFWHGAGWQFVVWGLMHGVYLTVNQTWRLLRPRFWRDSASYSRIMKPLGGVLTFSAVVVALVFFRADSVSSALSILNDMLGRNGLVPNDVLVLRQVGVEVPDSILSVFLPVAPWIWIPCLLAWVTLLPNSLELLRAYQPAVDYPEDATEPRSLLQFARKYSVLNHVTAIVTALICLLGVLMLNRGQTFIYWNF